MTGTPFTVSLSEIDHANPDSELCPTCRHLLSAHDSTSVRWCAVTERGASRRDCICKAVESSTRGAKHY